MKARLILCTMVFSTASYAGDRRIHNPYYLRLDAGKVSQVIMTQTFKQEPGEIVDRDRPYFWSIGLGYQFYKNLSAELSFSHIPNFSHRVEVPDSRMVQRFQSNYYMLNMIASLPLSPAFSPYLIAGIGYSRLRSGDFISISNQSTVRVQPGKMNHNLAAQLGVGVLFKPLNDPISFDISYRCVYLGKSKSSNYTTYPIQVSDGESVYTVSTRDYTPPRQGKLYMHQIMVGLRYEFNLTSGSRR